jgi:hypothetical protein
VRLCGGLELLQIFQSNRNFVFRAVHVIVLIDVAPARRVGKGAGHNTNPAIGRPWRRADAFA